MKQLIIDGKPTQFFFDLTTSFDDIFEWIQERVMFDFENNVFRLNEQHSCSCSNHIDGGISISGDEDLKIITIDDLVSSI